jgi:hypothetical protein
MAIGIREVSSIVILKNPALLAVGIGAPGGN